MTLLKTVGDRLVYIGGVHRGKKFLLKGLYFDWCEHPIPLQVFKLYCQGHGESVSIKRYVRAIKKNGYWPLFKDFFFYFHLSSALTRKGFTQLSLIKGRSNGDWSLCRELFRRRLLLPKREQRKSFGRHIIEAN